MLEKVKEIVAENLGADINTLTEETFSRMILERIPWIFLRWLWLWKKSTAKKSRQKIWKSLQQSEKLLSI